MINKNLRRRIISIQQIPYLFFLFKWIFFAAVISICVGSASAFFLVSLDFVTNYRENHLWIMALLPLGGLIIGFTYHYLGTSVVKGNNQLLEEFYNLSPDICFCRLGYETDRQK